MEQKPIDFVVIGDTVTDAFIRITRATVHTIEEEDGTEEEDICFVNGAKIPYDFAKVIPGAGNSANAATAATKLGLQTLLIADVGDDKQGAELISTLNGHGINTSYIKTNAGKATNYNYILWHKAERTILTKHETYEYKLPEFPTPKWIYFSSLGENSIAYHDEILSYLNNHPEVKLAFQPGTFQIKLGAEKLKGLYTRCNIFFCNTDEARTIIGTEEQDPAKLPKMMSELGPKIAIITDGPKGLYAYDANVDKTWFIPPYPDPKPPYERTGAGDACSSTIAAALELGLPLNEAVLWGPINSMSVVQYVGSQEGLLSREQIEKYLAEKPENYFAHEIV